ncbi:MAG: hypothetical protein GX595_06870, partial [Lentisphaerae bacterium]|nr:hypothetical protein [Lentisphaerota bacterium]
MNPTLILSRLGFGRWLAPQTPPRRSASRSVHAPPPSGRSRAIPALTAAAALLALALSPAAQAAITVTTSSQIVSNQGILPHSPWTPLWRVELDCGADADAGNPSNLSMSWISTQNFNRDRDIAEIRVVATSPTTVAFNPTLLSDYEPANYAKWTAANGWEGFGTISVLDPNGPVRLPVPATAAAANACYWIIVRTSDAIPGDITDGDDNRARFQSRIRLEGSQSGTPNSYNTGNRDTTVITCEAQIVDMIPYSSMNRRGGYPPGNQLEYVNAPLAMNNIIQSDHPAGGLLQREIMGVYDPYPLLALNIAGRSGNIGNLNPDEDILLSLRGILEDSGRQGNFSSADLASHPLSRYPNLTLWEDANNDGAFDPNTDRLISTVSSGAPWGTNHITVSPIAPGPSGEARWEFTLNVQDQIHGTDQHGGPHIDTTVDGRPDFFLCTTTVPDHGWVTSVPLYGADFRMFMEPGDNLSFRYAGRTDPTQGGMPAYASTLAQPLAAQDNLIDLYDTTITVPYVPPALTLTVASAVGFDDPNGNWTAYLRISDATNAEVLSYTDIVGNAFTLSAPASFSFAVGAVVTSYYPDPNESGKNYVMIEGTVPVLGGVLPEFMSYTDVFPNNTGTLIGITRSDYFGTMNQPIILQHNIGDKVYYPVSNNPAALAQAIDNSQTTILLTSGEAFPDPDGTRDVFILCQSEIMRYNDREEWFNPDDGNTYIRLLDVQRGYYDPVLTSVGRPATRAAHAAGQTVIYFDQPGRLATALPRSIQYQGFPFSINDGFTPDRILLNNTTPAEIAAANQFPDPNGVYRVYAQIGTEWISYNDRATHQELDDNPTYVVLTGVKRGERGTSLAGPYAAGDAVTGEVPGIFLEATKSAQVMFDLITHPADPVEADGFPSPVLMFNMCDSRYEPDNEKLHWVRLHFRQTAPGSFKPSDLAPLSDDALSGVSLWRDQKRGVSDLDQQGLLNPRGGIAQLTVADENIQLSAESLVWYNGTDDSVWSPDNDDPNGHYYVVVKPKTAIDLYPHDFVNNLPTYSDDRTGAYKGMDYIFCVRGGGAGKPYPTDPARWYERGPDYGDSFRVSIDNEQDIQFGFGFHADPTLFPVTNTATVSTVPTFFSDMSPSRLTSRERTAVVGIDLVAPLGRNVSFNHIAFQIYDTGDANFQISDLVDPNATVDDCGIAIYKDNGSITGVFDPQDTRVRMTGLPRLETMAWMNPAYHIVELDLDPTSVGAIPTSNTGEFAGPDYFIVLQPTPSADPGDDFYVQLWGSTMLGTRDDTISFTGDADGITFKRLRTGTMTVETVTNTILTNQVPAGIQVYPGQGPLNAVGIDTYDPLGSATLRGLRAYFETTMGLDPNDILAPLNGTATGGVSVSSRTGGHQATQPTVWRHDFTDGLVHIGGGTQEALSTGDTLAWFTQANKLVWIDTDKNGVWNAGDALFIESSALPVTARVATYDLADTLIAGTPAPGTEGVVEFGGNYGFAYYDAGAPGYAFGSGDDIYFLGPGRSTIGWYADLVLTTPAALPTDDVGANAPPDFYLRYTAKSDPSIYGDLQFSFYVPNNGVTFSTGYSYADTDRITNLVTMRFVPTAIQNFLATRGNGSVSLSWTLPAGTTYPNVLILRTEGTAPGAGEVPSLSTTYTAGQFVGAAKIVYRGTGSAYLDLDVVNDTPYYYQAFAGDTNGNGTIDQADMISATPFPVTPTGDVTAPEAVTDLVISNADPNQLNLSWNLADPADVKGVLILRRSDDAYPDQAPVNEYTYAPGDALGSATVVAYLTAASDTVAAAGVNDGADQVTLDDASAFPDPDGTFVAYIDIAGTTFAYTDRIGNVLQLLSPADLSGVNDADAVAVMLTRMDDLALTPGTTYYY